MNDLPLELIELIALQSPSVWFSLVQVFRYLANISQEAWYKHILQEKLLFKRFDITDIIGIGPFKITYKIAYILNDQLHTIIDPCIIIDGTQIWYKNGAIHRDDDHPAKIYPDGTTEWWRNGNLHRDNDQPARIYANNFVQEELRGTQERWTYGVLDRDDGPAIIRPNGEQQWWKNGRRYKINLDKIYSSFRLSYGLLN